jgi:hypothetical protein
VASGRVTVGALGARTPFPSLLFVLLLLLPATVTFWFGNDDDGTGDTGARGGRLTFVTTTDDDDDDDDEGEGDCVDTTVDDAVDGAWGRGNDGGVGVNGGTTVVEEEDDDDDDDDDNGGGEGDMGGLGRWCATVAANSLLDPCWRPWVLDRCNGGRVDVDDATTSGDDVVLILEEDDELVVLAVLFCCVDAEADKGDCVSGNGAREGDDDRGKPVARNDDDGTGDDGGDPDGERGRNGGKWPPAGNIGDIGADNDDDDNNVDDVEMDEIPDERVLLTGAGELNNDDDEAKEEEAEDEEGDNVDVKVDRGVVAVVVAATLSLLDDRTGTMALLLLLLIELIVTPIDIVVGEDAVAICDDDGDEEGDDDGIAVEGGGGVSLSSWSSLNRTNDSLSSNDDDDWCDNQRTSFFGVFSSLDWTTPTPPLLLADDTPLPDVWVNCEPRRNIDGGRCKRGGKLGDDEPSLVALRDNVVDDIIGINISTFFSSSSLLTVDDRIRTISASFSSIAFSSLNDNGDGDAGTDDTALVLVETVKVSNFVTRGITLDDNRGPLPSYDVLLNVDVINWHVNVMVSVNDNDATIMDAVGADEGVVLVDVMEARLPLANIRGFDTGVVNGDGESGHDDDWYTL